MKSKRACYIDSKRQNNLCSVLHILCFGKEQYSIMEWVMVSKNMSVFIVYFCHSFSEVLYPAHDRDKDDLSVTLSITVFLVFFSQ